MTTDNYSTIRATWDVVKTNKTPVSDPVPDEVVASFMRYQHCYVFMMGIATALGTSFNPEMVAVKDCDTLYVVVSRDVYVGKEP